MPQQSKILIADANEEDAQFVSFCLTQVYYETKIVSDPLRIPVTCANFRPDLILMEAVFPGREPFEVYRELRKYTGAPVLFLSDASTVEDKVRGLDLGADDYLTKPCDARELLARVRAVLRRTAPADEEGKAAERGGEYVEYPDLLINRSTYSVFYKGKSVDLPPKELELLFCLAASPNQVFSREQLLDQLWGYDYMGDTRTVDVHIKRLREKFKANDAWEIRTVWGIGYKFEVKETAR